MSRIIYRASDTDAQDYDGGWHAAKSKRRAAAHRAARRARIAATVAAEGRRIELAAAADPAVAEALDSDTAEALAVLVAAGLVGSVVTK